MLRFPLVALVVLFTTMVTGVAFAETGVITTGIPLTKIATSTNTPLLLDAVRITNAKSIILEFNQAVRVDTIRVRIVDQETNESVKISSITESTASGTLAIINTILPLTAGASYVLTITSAFSLTDMTIKAGIDSIREFTVPISLPGASFNAPPNPSAVIASNTPTTGSKTPILSGSTLDPRATVKNEALPATGMPTVIVIILAAISALGLLVIRKRA